MFLGEWEESLNGLSVVIRIYEINLFIIIIIIITINYFFFHGNLERNGRELIIKGLSETLIFF